MKRIVFLIIYYALAYRLPNYSFPGGKFYNWLRIFCLKRIIKIGDNCRIMRNVYVGNGKDIIIGDNCRVNENIRLDNVSIGNHVMIARDTVFLGKTHNSSDLLIPMEKQGNLKLKQTIIKDDVWIGLRVIVMPALTIAKGSIIGAGAVLTKSTEDFGVYGGVPAKKIKSR